MKKKCIVTLLIAIVICTLSAVSVFASAVTIPMDDNEIQTDVDSGEDTDGDGVVTTNLDVTDSADDYANIVNDGFEDFTSEQTTREATLYKADEKIELKDEIINGSAYLLGKNVNLKSEIINGDLFICANTVELDEDTIINGNCFICASNVKISASLSRELFCVAKDVIFDENSSVEYDVNITAEHISTQGNFYRNFNASVENMEIGENTKIIENLNYTSDKEAQISDDAVIQNVNYSKQVKEKKTVMQVIAEYVLDFARYFVLTMVLLILFIKACPRFVENLKNQLRVSSFGIGILSLILVPIALVLLLLLRVTSTVALAVLAVFILILILSMGITNITLAKKLEEKKSEIKLPIWTAIVTAVTWIIYQIPVLGAILAFIWVATGLGMTVRYCFAKKK